MSWADDYFKLLEEEKKKKKKNEEKKTTPTFETSPYSAMGRLAIASSPQSAFQQATKGASQKWKEDQEKKEEEEASKIFTKGALKDGFSVKNVGKAILGSVTDVRENLATGVLGIGESFVDTAAWLAEGGARLIGDEDTAEGLKDFRADDIIDEKAIAKKIIGIDTWAQKKLLGVDSEDSFLGGEADNFAQSIGNRLAMMAGASVGIPWQATAGVSAFGSATEQAAREDASFIAGTGSGLVSAGAEIIGEYMFGGSGLGEKGLFNVDNVTKGISNKLLKVLADHGVDMATEGFEEIFSDFASNLGTALYKEESLDEILFSEEALEGYLRSFVTAGLTSGIMNAGKAIGSYKAGKDYRTGMTDNEQKVFDKVYKDAIQEAEKDGKLTNKEKAEIYDRVLEDMKNGYIGTDVIEEVLGDRSSYDALETEAKEFDKLYNTASMELSKAQQDRLAELEAKNKANPYQDLLKAEKDKYSQSVFDMVKGDRLSESYAERSRRGQAFEADLSKYDKKQQETIRKAIDSGILNNTNRTHAFVDMVAKISADKGVLFDFTNNEKLKNSGFVVDGKQVNGFVTKDGITVNVNSSKSLNKVVGHEIAHVLEGTELYGQLQEAITEYAKSKGEYKSRYDALAKLYENTEGANIDAELTAELVGDYLFADQDFVNNLSVQNQNVFQKIWDEVKYLAKVATAGSKEARELAKVQRAFEKAYRESKAQKNTADGGAKYSVETLPDGKKYVRADRQVVFGNDPDSWSDQVESYINGKIRNGENISLVAEDGEILVLTADTAGKIASNKTSHGTTMADEKFYVKANAGVHIDELAQVSVNDNPNKKPKADLDGRHGDFAEGGWTYRTAFFHDFDGKYYRLKISAAIGKDGTVVYNIGDIEERSFPKVTGSSAKGGALNGKASSGDNVAQNGENVKYSLSDSEGRQLTKEQAEYFRDSKIRDKDGNLKVMYHGSGENFTVFDRKKAKSSGYYGSGFYFTDSDSHAKQYGNAYDVYLNITNPLQDGTNDITKDQLRKFVEAVAENEDYGIENYGYGATVNSVTNSVYGKSDFAMIMDINASCVGNMVEAIELFNDVNGTNYNGIIAATETVAFYPEQIKRTDNTNPTSDPDIRNSLSEEGQAYKPGRGWNVRGEDIALENAARPAENVANVSEDIAPVAEDLFPDTNEPGVDELMAEAQDIMGAMEAYEAVGDTARAERLAAEYEDIMEKIGQMERDQRQRADSLTDADVPPEMDAPYYGDNQNADPFADREWDDVVGGKNRNVKAYMYEHPEVKPYFQAEAAVLFDELQATQKGERWYNDELYYESGGEQGYGGTKRRTSDSIARMLDEWNMSYADIEKGLKAIMEDNGAENISAAKKVEFMLNERLRDGYKSFTGYEPNMDQYGRVMPNQEYIDTVQEASANAYSQEAFDALMAEYAPVAEKTAAPVKYEAIRQKPTKEPAMAKATPAEQAQSAKILFGEQQSPKQKNAWKWAKEHIFRHGAVFEDLSLKTGNRELQAKFDMIRRAESRAQTFIGKGGGNAKALVDVKNMVEKAGKTEAFNYYLYHLHNVDRMTLEQRFADVPNKAVFGDAVTAEVSQKAATNLETLNPEFKQWAEDVYAINRHLRQMMVDEGMISQETADLWQKMYPHYVPINRADAKGMNVNVPLDTKRTGVNAPIKKATGGNSDFYNVFDTMGARIEQTYKAIAKNRFGVELKNTLGTEFDSEAVDIDSVMESVDNHEQLLQEGKNGESPSFTVFENGERVTYAITEDMYEAMKPSQFTYTNEALKKVNDVRRDILTTYNPTFALTNPIKDVQDIFLNSQHPVRTYATIPEAIKSVLTKDQWYQERMENGGNQDSYFDGQTKTFQKEDGMFKKVMGFPFEKIQAVNEVIEQVPRMAEYIASRKMGRSVDVSMLDAARVTTNFGAPGDFTNMLNRNGFTFLGASVEGFNQQVRNMKEAKAEGVKGVLKLAAKTVAVGLPAMLLNHLLWDDDEDYEELSDYVKQNFYVIAKTEEGKFIRIPKGRAVAVIQDAFQQMANLVTGNDKVDLASFAQLLVNNLAPNNPLENNILAPIGQAITNKAWYGGDLVPTRLQDLPAAEQFDETTDSFSKWLGDVFDISPYKVNYLLDQYSGGVGDIVLPYLTPEADGGGLGAAFRDKFVTDPVLKNQNVTDFYDKKDELAVNANSMYATEEDKLMAKYMSSVNAQLSQLYTEKREIQNSDMSDAEKYAAVRDIQAEIVELTRMALDRYDDIRYSSARDGEYAHIGNKYFKRDEDGQWQSLSSEQAKKYRITSAAGDASYAYGEGEHYRWYEPDEDSDAEAGWRKITDSQLKKQAEVTKGLGITPEEYWSNKEEYDYAYEHPGNYAMSKAVGGYTSYRTYSSELYDIKADKDKYGKSITGSRKEKVIDYINDLDLDAGAKYILLKSEYPSDNTYNYEIIEYLDSRADISYEEMKAILEELGFYVNGNRISWD